MAVDQEARMHYKTQTTRALAAGVPAFTDEARAAFLDWLHDNTIDSDPVEERMLAACGAGHGVLLADSRTAWEDEPAVESVWALPDGTLLHYSADSGASGCADYGTDLAGALAAYSNACASLVRSAVCSGWTADATGPVRVTDEAVDILDALCDVPLADVVALLDADAARADLVAVALTEPTGEDLAGRRMLAGLTF